MKLKLLQFSIAFGLATSIAQASENKVSLRSTVSQYFAGFFYPEVYRLSRQVSNLAAENRTLRVDIAARDRTIEKLNRQINQYNPLHQPQISTPAHKTTNSFGDFRCDDNDYYDMGEFIRSRGAAETQASSNRINSNITPKDYDGYDFRPGYNAFSKRS